ncbi:MAG: outer membrane beta-barrel protein, partial [Bacteroidales bacterium]
IGRTGRAFGYAGFYLGYLMYAEIKGTVLVHDEIDPENTGTYIVDREYTSDIDRIDYGAVMGLGLDYTLANRYRIFADGRFNWGWANVARPGNGKIFNNVWSVSLGIMYHL